MVKFLCPSCWLPVETAGTYDPETGRTVVLLDLDEHDCNPRLARFFNPDSQHFPPFTR